jgi:hypothetical protein
MTREGGKGRELTEKGEEPGVVREREEIYGKRRTREGGKGRELTEKGEEPGVVREREEIYGKRRTREVGIGKRVNREGWRTWRYVRTRRCRNRWTRWGGGVKNLAESGDVGTEGRGRDEELGVVRENGDVGTEGRGWDEELGVVRENGDVGTEVRGRDEELGLWERERRHGNRGTR